jgi:N,N'-diacetylchitobiose phosphorylase
MDNTFGRITKPMQYGHFDNVSREYVIDSPDIPVSWTNYLGVKDLCGVISHNAGGYMFYKSPRTCRISRFRPNSIPIDRPGRYVYLRDNESGDYWSISWQPGAKDLQKARYTARHGLSYSSFCAEYSGISATQTVFIPLDDPVEIWRVRVRNTGTCRRSLGIFSYLEFAFLDVAAEHDYQYVLYASSTFFKDGIIQYSPLNYGDYFFASNFEPDSFDADRETFLGAYRTESNPEAVERGVCSNKAIEGGNPCASLHKNITLAPGEEREIIFIAGVGKALEKGMEMRKKFCQPNQADVELSNLARYWDAKLGSLQSQTPHAGFDTHVNIWNLYQVETCVAWSRFASFTEVTGRVGLGFRDTAQDVMAVVHSNPKRSRERIIQLLSAQVADGYGIHWFDPAVFVPGKAVAPPLSDVCSDDVLWLIVTICEYVKETGDVSFFDYEVPFADSGTASVWEHMKRGLDFSGRTIGKNGICRGLRSDWNDCLNLKGNGETSMVTFQHAWALREFIAAAEFLKRADDAGKYMAMLDNVNKTAAEKLWDGKWFIRGITDSGNKIGSDSCTEGKIFLNAQTWAVISGVAQKDKAVAAMDCAYEMLFTDYGMHLLAPSYSKPDSGIGFVTSYPKGMKENGAIFSHANTWAVIAECLLCRGDRAFEIYSSMLPYLQNDKIEIRKAEPYVYCQTVIGKDQPQFGRACNAWLTGTAGWFYTAATRYILGFRPQYDGFIIDPCVPSSWDNFSFSRIFRGIRYNVEVKNPDHVEKGVREIYVDGKKSAFPVIPVLDKQTCRIEVILG